MQHLFAKIVNGFQSLIIYEKRLTGFSLHSQLTFTCPKLTIETLEKGVKYVQS